MQENNRIGIANFIPGTLDSHFLNQVNAVSQPGGVHHVHRHAFDLDGLLDLVSGGAGDWCHDGKLGTRQGIEQRRFTRIGLPRNHHFDTLPQQRALAGAIQDLHQSGLQFGELPLCIRLFQKIDLFLGKVQGGFNQHAQADQCITKGMNVTGKLAQQGAARAAGGRLGAGVDQVCNRFGLRQIDLPVQEGPMGKFTWACNADSPHAR